MRVLWSCHLFAILLAGCAAEKAPPGPPETLPVATTLPAPTLAPLDRPILLIYRDAQNARSLSARDRLDAAVWADGRIVWRADRSLLTGRVEPARIDQLLQDLHRQGVFGEGDTYFASYGPDASFTVIEIHLADRRLKLASWHERYEQNPRLVVTSRGIESLNGRDPAELLVEDTPEYQRFRQVWSEIRTAVRSWQPAEGEAFTGEVPLVGG